MAAAAPPLEERLVPAVAGDGHPLQLINVRGEDEPTLGPVLLIHGAGVRANMFRPPVQRSIVDVLIAEGFDVWLENWRASADFPGNSWTLDQAALYDHPAAVRTVLRETKAETLKAVIHCQGSTSFALSVVAGLVHEVTTVVTNSVTLHPVVPNHAAIKLHLASGILAHVTDHVDPMWGIHPEGRLAKAIAWGVGLTHRECDNAVCTMASFANGVGHPVMWSHALLNQETHDWLTYEWGPSPMSFYLQMAKSALRKELVMVEGFSRLPGDLLGRPPETDARFVLLTGMKNRCFLPESQYRTLRYLEKHRPGGPQRLVEIPNYGHLDIFFGQHSARDVFPHIVTALQE